MNRRLTANDKYLRKRSSDMSKNIKGFILGVICTVTVAALVIPAAAQGVDRDIRVRIGGISIYVDGTLTTPRDGNGNVVEPMIYNGVTYLPLRALTNILTDKEVSWDAATQSVHIGGENGNGPSLIMGSPPLEGGDAQFRILDRTVSPRNAWKGVSDNVATYALNSGYSSIRGEFVIDYREAGASARASLQLYSVSSAGRETLIEEYTVSAGDRPVAVNTNISGVGMLRIKLVWRESSFSTHVSPVFYNVSFSPKT